MLDFSVSRRRLLAGASATTLAGAFVGSRQAMAKAPMLNTPAPEFYPFKLGAIEATVISDGPLAIGDPKNTFRGPTPEELGKLTRPDWAELLGTINYEVVTSPRGRVTRTYRGVTGQSR